ERGLAQVLPPAAAEGADQMHGGNEALPGQLRVGALGLKRVAAGINNFEVTDDAGTITVRRQLRSPARVCHGALLSCCLVRQITNAGQAALDLAKGHK